MPCTLIPLHRSIHCCQVKQLHFGQLCPAILRLIRIGRIGYWILLYDLVVLRDFFPNTFCILQFYVCFKRVRRFDLDLMVICLLEMRGERWWHLIRASHGLRKLACDIVISSCLLAHEFGTALTMHGQRLGVGLGVVCRWTCSHGSSPIASSISISTSYGPGIVLQACWCRHSGILALLYMAGAFRHISIAIHGILALLYMAVAPRKHEDITWFGTAAEIWRAASTS